MNQINYCRRLWTITIMLIFFSSFAYAQVDTTGHKKDTMVVTKPDTVVVTPAPTPVPPPPPPAPAPASNKGIWVLYGGVTFNKLHVSSDNLESSSKTGWQAGLNYRRGNFIYWQVGVRYNSARYGVKDSAENNFTVNDLGIPLTAGLSLFSATKKAINFRVFISAIPSFLLSVSDNPKYTKDDTNSFFWAGQAGIGLDFLFLVVEAGYNYGFTDVLKNTNSKPRQGFVTIGFKF